ncbi:LysR family transcriptional regulator [Pararhizobium qamdonense]|uniref:LysR family transcriptional regulator n=1 Tax=Pararhizobium qamdonense TaxID=3031126 RepID=UPI0023E0A3D5|nr:LysR family transcriptional regulator [Pararhizobium qamdonense]
MAVVSALGNLSLRQLEVFYAVVEAGSVTAAAESLRVSQPTVSAMLKRIEDQLGLALFRKDRGRLVPTNEGMVLHGALQRNFKYLQSVSDAISIIQKNVSQILSIASIPPLGNGVVADAMRSFLAERPDARVHLLVRPRRVVYDSVATGGVDLGISFRTGEAEQEGLRTEQVTSGRIFCIMPKGHPLESQEFVHQDDLHHHALVSYPPGHQWLMAQFEKTLVDGRTRPDQILTVDSVTAVYPHVENGVGIAIVDEYSLMYHSKERISARPFVPPIDVAIELNYPDRKPSQLTQVFVEHFKAVCAKLGQAAAI